jgi:hypothetical protein
MLRRWIGGQFRAVGRTNGFGSKVRRLGVTVIGIGWGVGAMLGSAGWRPTPPRRDDEVGRDLRVRLSGGPIGQRPYGLP